MIQISPGTSMSFLWVSFCRLCFATVFLLIVHTDLNCAEEKIFLLDPSAIFSKELLIPYLGLDQKIDSPNSLRRTDQEMEVIWSSLRDAEKRGARPTIFTSARLYAFGGGQDIPYFIEYGAKSDPHLLTDVPSLLLISGASKIYAEVSLARDEKGNHLKNVIQYVNPILGHNISMEVPIKLQEPSLETEKGQHQAAQYKWGNVNGLRGLKVKITTDNPLVMKTGGFEVSNAYNWNLDQWTQVFLAQLGEHISTAQMFAASRFAAQNVLKDPSGFQGVLAALGGVSRNYFAKNLMQKKTSKSCETIVLQHIYSKECAQKIAEYLNRHAMIILPKASFHRREPASPRHGKYTSKMMAGLAKKGHLKTLENIQEMRQLVSQIEKALLSEDDLLFIQATSRYTDLRIEAQETWLRLALQAKDQPDYLYFSFFHEAKEDPFLKGLLEMIASKNSTDLRHFVPYLGGHFDLLELARKNQVSCIPNGAGGFHCSWAIFGAPDHLRSFLTEAQLTEEISLELFENTLLDSESKEVILQGIIPLKANLESGVGVNQDFIDIYGEFQHTLPLYQELKF